MINIVQKLAPPLLMDSLRSLIRYFGFFPFKGLVRNNLCLRGAYKEKRVFLLGSAPSILKENLRPLKNEAVMALNNFYVHDDFSEIISGNAPKFYMTAPIHPPQTEDEWKRWFEDMERNVPIAVKMLFGLNGYSGNAKHVMDKYDLFRNHEKYWYYASRRIGRDYEFNVKDIVLHGQLWSASTVSTYALLAAVYMGFREIYLLGVDHNYVCLRDHSKHRFFSDAIHQVDERKRMGLSKSGEFFNTGMVFKEAELIAEYCEGVKIFNCSLDSLLGMFDYVSLQDVLADYD